MDDRPGSSGFTGRGRLPSFKSPRDLTLVTGTLPIPPRSRRNYVPNIPPKRDRSGDSLPSAITSLSQSLPSSSRTRPNTNNGNRQSGQRERKKIELVQSTSIFGEGVGNPLLNPKRHSAPSARGRGGISISSANRSELLGKNKDKNATADRHKRDLGEPIGGFDNFIADLDEGTVPEGLVPISLPLSEYIHDLYESESDEEIEPAVHIKSEFATECSEQKPRLMKASFAQLLSKAPPEGTLIFIQFPDQLPVLDQTTADSKTVKATKLSNDIGVLPEGYIGKIQILASGRSRFVLGENNFDLETGKLVGFRQELASIDEETKKMTILGHVQYKFNCTPEINSLFKHIL